MKVKLLLLPLLFLCSLYTQAQDSTEIQKQQAVEARRLIGQGNDLYEKKKYNDARNAYNEALQKDPKNETGHFNEGDALYRSESFDDADKKFGAVAERSEDKGIKSKALHNQGNARMQQENYEGAIESYKQALKENPQDEETRHNLTYAKKMQQKQQQQQQQNGQGEGEGEGEGQTQQGQSQGQGPNSNPNNQGGGGNKPSPQELEGVSQQNAERMLDALNEQESQKRKAQGGKDGSNANASKGDKDW